MTGEARRKEIREVHKSYDLFYAVLGGVFLLLIGVLIGALLFGSDNQNYHMNLFTEALGVIGTVILVNRWYSHREQRRQREDLQRRLVIEAGSRSNDIAVAAIEHLHANDWLAGELGLLRNARLDYADLQKADLRSANLELAWLWRANLHQVNLFGANLKGAYLSSANLQTDLRYANLQEAILVFANLQGARMTHANLKGADLQSAYMQGADIRGADMQGAILTNAELEDAKFSIRTGNEKVDQSFDTTLPDGSLHTENVDLAKFTDSEHPDYDSTLEKIMDIRRTHNLDNRLPPVSRLKF